MTFAEPIPPPTGETPSDPDPAPSNGSHPADPGRRRHRYGRRRGHLPVGDAFIARLGPSGEEPFAGIDDPEEADSRERPAPETLIEDLHFVALDCETTGQSPHRLVELGAVAFTLDRHVMSFETLVHSTDRINPYARRIHGIGPDTLGGAPPVDRVLARFRRFAQGAVLIEHSADAFDTRLIARTMGTDLDADNVDTSRLAGKLWQLKDTIGLEKMCIELGVRHRRPHHALADAEATAACFVELVRRGREAFGWRTLGDLLADGQPPPPRPPEERRPRRPRPTTAEGERPEGAPRRRRRRGGRRHGRAAPPAEPSDG